jgi:aldehyde dehydrogenase (NAD+)
LEKSAKHLSSTTLELGGKSPCIIFNDADIDKCSKKILWGKIINAGQTCIAPDYVLIQKDVKESFYTSFKKNIRILFNDNICDTSDYGRIVNNKHFLRIKSYLSDGKIISGGQTDNSTLFIEPTLLEISDLEKPVMRDEIFGPILPVIEFSSFDDIKRIIEVNKNPLALYVFSNNKNLINKVVSEIPAGGVCVNNTMLHAINHNLPFGGRGKSGIGSYHGKNSFDSFSHKKSVMLVHSKFNLEYYYPPYRNLHKKITKFLMR